MKVKKKKKLSLNQAENKLLNIVSKHLASLPAEEAEKRIQKVHQLITEKEDRDAGSRSPQHSGIPASPLLSRNR